MNGYPVKEGITSLVSFFNSFCTVSLNSSGPSNLNHFSGAEVLEEIKTDPDLKLIPVLILTTAAAQEDILKSYSPHANCYITKPVDFVQFTRAVRLIEELWLAAVKLPVT